MYSSNDKKNRVNSARHRRTKNMKAGGRGQEELGVMGNIEAFFNTLISYPYRMMTSQPGKVTDVTQQVKNLSPQQLEKFTKTLLQQRQQQDITAKILKEPIYKTKSRLEDVDPEQKALVLAQFGQGTDKPAEFFLQESKQTQTMDPNKIKLFWALTLLARKIQQEEKEKLAKIKLSQKYPGRTDLESAKKNKQAYQKRMKLRQAATKKMDKQTTQKDQQTEISSLVRQRRAQQSEQPSEQQSAQAQKLTDLNKRVQELSREYGTKLATNGISVQEFQSCLSSKLSTNKRKGIISCIFG